MQLYVAAINHFDVLGRQKLRRWLEHLRDTHQAPPAFVAVEYAPADFDSIMSQRYSLAHLASTSWPDAPPALISALGPTLAYEADTYLEVFPEPVEVLWLDQSTPQPDRDLLPHFAQRRLDIYQDYWREAGSPPRLAGALAAMSRAAWDKVAKQDRHEPSQATTRDDQLARVIIKRVEEEGGDWAVIVLGAHHATDQPGRTLRRLRDAGIPCCVESLD